MKILILSFALCAGTLLLAQDSNKNILRSITVTGSAELEVVPDEIIAGITITEYYKEEYIPGKEAKDYQDFVELSEVEKEFLSRLQSAGIKKERLIVQNAGTQWNYYVGRNRLSKEYKISFSNFEEFDKLIAALQMHGIAQLGIQELKHKDMAKFRMQVKAEAVKAAKEKAAAMLKPLDKKLGEVISISEISDNDGYDYRSNFKSNTIMGNDNAGSDQESFKKIKLRYEVNAVFEIQ